MKDEDNSLRDIHKNALASIIELVAAMEENDDEGRDAILEDALSIEVRSGWEAIGANLTASEYRILLTTGGPAVQIVGELNQWGEPETATLQVQDWFKPWTEFPTTTEEDSALMAYTSCFYFGE